MRISQAVLTKIASVLPVSTEVFIDHTSIPREVRVYEGDLKCKRFEGSNGNRLAYDYLIERLREEVEKER